MPINVIPNIITPNDVATTLGRTLTAAEERQVDLWVSDAQVVIARRLGDLTLLDAAVLKYVVREAVAEKVKRPDAASQTTIQIDDGSVSRRYEKDAGVIAIRDEWWDMLSPEATGSGAGAFTIRTRPRMGCW